MLQPLLRRLTTFIIVLFTTQLAVAQFQVEVKPQIIGSRNVCVNSNSIYSSNVTGNFTWTLNGLGTLSTPTGATTNVFWNQTGVATLTMTGITTAGLAISVSATINVFSLPEPTFFSNQVVGCYNFTDPENPGDVFQQGDCWNACAGSVVTYTTPANSFSTFEWNVVGGTFTASNNTCTVVWPNAVGMGSVSLTETNNIGCVNTKTQCIQIIPKPLASFSLVEQVMATGQACLEQEIHFFDQSIGSPSPIINWHWDFGDGTSFNSSTTVNPSHAYNQSGTYTITLTVTNACNCTDVFTYDIEITETPPVTIVCPGVVCQNQTATYSFDADCDEFQWDVIGGTIINQSGLSVDVLWDNVDISGFGYLNLTSTCSDFCPGTTTIKVPVINPNATILPQLTNVCTNRQYLYRLPAWPGTVFTWTLIDNVPGILLLPTDQPNEIVVQTNNDIGTFILKCTYNNDLLDCGGETFMEINVMAPATIKDPQTAACQNTSVSYQGQGFTGNWSWKITRPNGSNSVVPGNLNPFNTGTLTLVGNYIIEVITGSFCPPAPVTLTVVAQPSKPKGASGPLLICPGITYKYIGGLPSLGTTLQWSVTGGNIIGATEGPEVSVVFDPTGPYAVNVWRVSTEAPYCAGQAVTFNVAPEVVNPVITGNPAVCANTYAAYNVAYTRGEEYEWKVLDDDLGSVTTGNGTPNVTVLWNNTGIATTMLVVRIARCGVNYYDTLNVTIGGAPAITLSGDNNVCRGAAYNLVHNAPVGSNFEIDYGNGVVESYSNYPHSSFTYTYPNIPGNTDVNYTISVKVTNTSFCVNPVVVTKTITVKPSPAVAITPAGGLDTCYAGFTRQLAATLQAGFGSTASLTWHLPSGTQTPCNPTDPACNTKTATQFGNYQVIANASNGCSSASNIVSFVQVCGPATNGCTISPTPSLSINFITNACGSIEAKGNHSTGGSNEYWTWPGNLQNATVTPGTLSSTVTGNIKQAGSYNFTYHVVYNDINNDPCTTSVSKLVIVPLVPELYTGITCATGGYNLTLYDHSTRYPAAEITQYDFYLNGSQVQSGTAISYTHTSVLAPGTYTGKVVVHYIYGGSTFTCEKQLNIDLPALPVASYTFTMQNTCEGVPVVFTNTSTNYVTSLWDFGDQASNTLNNVERVFTSQQPTYNVLLTVRNLRGCSSSVSQTVNIVQNDLDDSRFLSATPGLICAGSTSQLVSAGSGSPTQYRWVNEGVTLFTGSNNTLAVSQTGYYWVVVSNANNCRATSPAANVTVKSLPNPVIKGKANQCEGRVFVLDGFAGTNLQYQWTRSDIGQFSTEPTVEENIALAGTYTYTLTILTADGLCSKSATFDVTVNPPPAPPGLNFTVSCAPFTVNLQASSAVPGRFNWSDGQSSNLFVTQSNVASTMGGPYRVTFTDAGGCSSATEIITPKDPQGYLWVFPTGCYSRCLPPSGEIQINGPIIPFDYWEWQQNGGGINSGNNLVDPLLINAPGTYGLLLNTSGCDALSGNLHLNILDDCENGEGCDELEVEMYNEVEDGCSTSFDLDLTNNTGTNYSYTVSADVGGIVQPNGGIMPQGSTTTQSFVWTAPFGVQGGGLVIFRVRVWLPDNRYCDRFFTREYNCGGGLAEGRTNSTAQKAKKPDSTGKLGSRSSAVTTSLLVVPNPASSVAIVKYLFEKNNPKQPAPNMAKQTRMLEVYSVLGVKVYSLALKDDSGAASINIANLASGIYNIVLRENGAAIKSSKLVVAR